MAREDALKRYLLVETTFTNEVTISILCHNISMNGTGL